MTRIMTTYSSRYTNEKGRTVFEILLVLSFSAILSLGALLGYNYALEKNRLNELIHTINMTDVKIVEALQNQRFSTPESMNVFLDAFTQYTHGYKISFYAPEYNFTGREFATKVENINGSPLNPNICKDLILSMEKIHSISALDVEKGNENKHIDMGTVDLDAICGK